MSSSKGRAEELGGASGRFRRPAASGLAAAEEQRGSCAAVRRTCGHLQRGPRQPLAHWQREPGRTAVATATAPRRRGRGGPAIGHSRPKPGHQRTRRWGTMARGSDGTWCDRALWHGRPAAMVHRGSGVTALARGATLQEWRRRSGGTRTQGRMARVEARYYGA